MGAENHYLSISELTPYHKKKIAELRQRAAADLDLYPEYNTDFQLLRWLMGWDYNIDVILPKLQTALRVSYNLGMPERETLEPEEINAQLRDLCNVAEYYPGGLMGTDDEGNVIFMQAIAKAHPKTLAKAGSVSTLLRLSLLEGLYVCKLILRGEARAGKKLGAKLIIDLEGFSMDLLHTPTLLIYKELLCILQANCPDVARKIYIINPPMMVKAAYTMISPVLSKQTREKVEFLGSDWKEVLVRELGAHNIYPHWGGIKPHPKPTGDLRMGGKVPEKFWYAAENNPMEQGLTKITVPARNRTEVRVHCEEGTELIWLWRVSSGDLDFSVEKDGIEVFPKFRLSTEFTPEMSKMTVRKSGEYVLIFDNSHGSVWSKEVKYRVWQS